MDIDSAERWWWREYPERDREYVRWYPPDLRPMTGNQIWSEYADSIPKVFGIYFHIPFCEVVCPFCPYLKTAATEADADALVTWLIRELDLYKNQTPVSDYPIHFMYFGGGTPSILSAKSLHTLLNHVHKYFRVAKTAEATMEINPGYISEDKLRAFRAAGINRVSFGVQSFNDRWLKVIGSHHTANQTLDSIRWAKKARFDNVGVDLLFRLPGQSIQDWQEELTQAITQGLEHISTYSMVLDPEGGLGRQIVLGKIPPQPDEDEDLTMSRMAFELLGEAGFHHYASCASCGHDFAKPERESNYEVLHWGAPQAPYIGIGPGAYGFVNDHTYCTLHDLFRYQQYISNNSIPVVAAKRLTREDSMARYFVLGVKCIRVRLDPFRKQFGEEPLAVFAEPLAWLQREGLAELTHDELKLTRRGVLYMDNVSKAFYTPDTLYCPQPLEHDMQALSQQGQFTLLGATR